MEEENKDLNEIHMYHLHGYSSQTCGYCKAQSAEYKSRKKLEQKQWISMGFQCEKMSPELYDQLMNLGWRRCGYYYYKCKMDDCCCRPYTIRMDAEKFKIRSSHQKIQRRFEKYLKNETKNKEEGKKEQTENKKQELPKIANTEEYQKLKDVITSINLQLQKHFGQDFQQISQTDFEQSIQLCKNKKIGEIQTNYLIKTFLTNKTWLKEKLKFGKIEDFTKFIKSEIIKDNLAVEINLQDNGFISYKKQSIEQKPLQFEEKKQQPKKDKKINKQKQPIEQILKQPARQLEIKLVKAQYDNESFGMYKRYCKVIHGSDKEDPDGYKNFLCLQALEYKEIQKNGKTLYLGSYHQKYYLDGKLVAVGVIDLLPTGMSSVYFFYEPEEVFLKLNFGIFASIKEIEWIQEQKKAFPEFCYYYLGFYIQNNKKMSYKGDFEPAELLDPGSYQYAQLTPQIRELITKEDIKTANLKNKNLELIDDLDFSKSDMKKLIEKKIIFLEEGRQLKLSMMKSTLKSQVLKIMTELIQGMGKKAAFSFKYAFK